MAPRQALPLPVSSPPAALPPLLPPALETGISVLGLLRDLGLPVSTGTPHRRTQVSASRGAQARPPRSYFALTAEPPRNKDLVPPKGGWDRGKAV